MICVIRPMDDEPAAAVGEWWAHVRNRPAFALLLTDPTRDVVTDALKGARGIFYFGHGTEDALISHGSTRLVDATNIEAARAAVVVAMACLCGVQLAGQAVENGVRSYIGFSRKLALVDTIRDEFAGAGAEAASVLFSGGTVEAAVKAMREKFGQIFVRYKEGSGRGRTNATLCWVTADRNADSIVITGDRTATLSSDRLAR